MCQTTKPKQSWALNLGSVAAESGPWLPCLVMSQKSKIGKRLQRASVKEYELWSYCASSSYMFKPENRDPARPRLAIPDILRNPLREVGPNSRLSSTLG